MTLVDLFQTDDGSLPEVELRFPSQDGVKRALLRAAARTTRTADLTHLSLLDHIVVADLVVDAVPLPAIGFFVAQGLLILDYRMGEAWREPQIFAFLNFIRELRSTEGTVATPWWGDGSSAAWSAALAVPNPTFQRTASPPLN